MDKLSSLIARLRELAGTLPRRFVLAAAGALVAVALLFTALYVLYSPSGRFPEHSLFTIPQGMTISELAKSLEERGLIRSSSVFEKLVVILGKERGVIAGDYYFPRPFSLFEVARRITNGVHGLMPMRVTIPEGYTAEETANLFAGKFLRFDKEEFLSLAREREGYLFPDTYFFMPNVSAEHVFNLMTDNFESKTERFAGDIASSTKTLHEIVTMASIIEKEASKPEDRRVISGILWQRIKVGMPLQVDAAFSYVSGAEGRNTYELTQSDLELDSPYNTYKYKGLPPTPIANPGLDSIDAALRPSTTKYLYYLSDRQGNTYYAADFEGHKRNRELYLDN